MRTKKGEARLEEVRRQFEHWRRTRERRTRIPEPLWTAAVELAGMVGVGPTAKALGIHPDSLKRQVKAAADSALAGGRRRPLRHGHRPNRPSSNCRLPCGLPAVNAPWNWKRWAERRCGST